MKKIIITLIFLTLILTSCVYKNSENQNENKEENLGNSQTNTKNYQNEEQNGGQESPKNETKKVEKKAEVLSSKEALPQISNTIKSWYYKKTSTIPEIPLDAKTLLKKYNGIYLGNTSKKALYLTFDEGYENGYTEKILNTLKEKNVKAAFFVTGSYLKNNKKLIQRMIDEGHIVGNHTQNHPSMPKVKSDSIMEEEILAVERMFFEDFGGKMNYFRFPNGEYSEKTLNLVNSLGYKTVFWSFAYKDWDTKNQKGADYALNTIKSGVHNGAVLLLHAVSKDNCEALPQFIDDAFNMGYKFLSLDEIN